MQGEGQEFESPRLHHRQVPAPIDKSNSSGPIPETINPSDGGTCLARPPDPCPPALAGHRPADRWTTDRPRSSLSRGTPRACRTLTTGYVSAELMNLRFRRVVNNDRSRSDPNQRLATWSEAGGGQATKGTGWMPWRQEPMKDVAGCVKLRGVASRL